MKIAVIDLGYGDSGKGTVVAYLCHHYKDSIVVRYSGGHQAGHTVVHEGIKHIFSSFGSGTLQEIPTYWSKNCTFYPNAFLGELEVLKKKAKILIGIKTKIYVDSKCPVTTFADVKYNKMRNDIDQHGSCGVGFGATLEREENHHSITVGDLQFPSVLEEKLWLLLRNYYSDIEYKAKEVKDFLLDCNDVLKYINIVKNDDIVKHYNNIIYEGSQGLLLDKNIGFFPHVTRANVGSKAIGDDLDIVYYVTRAYQTRHGNGPMTNENIPHNILEDEEETNIENYQGKFRKSLLDLDLLKYSLYKDNTTAEMRRLVITCMDHVVNDLRFTYKGEVFKCFSEKDFIETVTNIMGIEKVYVSYSNEYSNIRWWNAN